MILPYSPESIGQKSASTRCARESGGGAGSSTILYRENPHGSKASIGNWYWPYKTELSDALISPSFLHSNRICMVSQRLPWAATSYPAILQPPESGDSLRPWRFMCGSPDSTLPTSTYRSAARQHPFGSGDSRCVLVDPKYVLEFLAYLIPPLLPLMSFFCCCQVP